MKRRKLKKTINYLAGELFAECIALMEYEKVNEQSVSLVMEHILMMQTDMINRLSHVEKGCTRLFFKKLREDIANQTELIVEDINGLICH